MSSHVMVKPLATNSRDQNVVSNNSAQLSAKEKQQIIAGLIAILEEDKLKPWFTSGLQAEYERRYRTPLPSDWVLVVEECGPDVIEVETQLFSNCSKTLIQLPIRKSNKSSVVAKPVAQASGGQTAQQKTDSTTDTVPNSDPMEAPEQSEPISGLKESSTIIVAPEPRSKTPEPKVAQLISLSPERPNPKSDSSKMTPVQTSIRESVEPCMRGPGGYCGFEPVKRPSYARYLSGLEELQPLDEEITVPQQKPVPNNAITNGQTNGINGTSDEPKAKTKSSAELLTGTVEDVISGGRSIPSPILPQVKPNPVNEEDFYDVVVLLAATPNNFVVVPYKNSNKGSDFCQLKYKMSELYEKEENRIDLPPEVIQRDIFVAAKSDDNWYRVQVRTVLSENPFLVVGFLCDFGEHKTFELSDIQPLYNCFRELPMQAVRASLATVAPIGSDWEAHICYEFRKMVENKPFVATVFGIREVDGHPVVSLSLCDTTGADDVYVGHELVAKRLAKPVVTSN